MRAPSRRLIGRIILVGLSLGAALVLDQLTKRWALDELEDGQVIELVPTVRLELTFNPGVAFGMGADIGSPLAFALAAVVLALVGWVAVRTIRNQDILATVFLAVTAGGAIGNLWDRFSRAEDGPLTGHVVDFIAVDWFAAFNVADIFTTSGIALWALMLATHARSSKEPARGRDRSRAEPAPYRAGSPSGAQLTVDPRDA